MAFFTFRQSNPGGFWSGPRFVVVEAENAKKANAFAVAKTGIYFNGVQIGFDCGCCGDRWSRVDDEDATDTPVIWGEDPVAGISGEDTATVFFTNGDIEKFNQ